MVKAIINLSLAILFLTTVSFAQGQLEGKWTAKYSEKNPEKIHLRFSHAGTKMYLNGKKHSYNHGSDFKYERLSGLSKEQVLNGGPVSFSIGAEAGTVQLNGEFKNRKGSGTFIFTPDPGFSAEADSLGLGTIKIEKLFSAAILDVKLATVSDLRNSGLEIDSFEDVFKATIFKIDGDYIAEMQSAGFGKLEMEDLVKTRIFKIDANYAREVNAMGFQDMSIEKLVKFRIFKITPSYLKDIREMGFSSPSVEDVVKMRIFKIDLDFVQDLERQGFKDLSIQDLVDHRIGIRKGGQKTF